MNRQTRVLLLMSKVLISLLLISCGVVEEMPLIKKEKKPEYKISGCRVGVPTTLLKVSVLHPPLTFNPVTALDDVSRLLSSQLTSTLYKYDPVLNRFEPSLATGYARGKESKIFTIQLRRNITFSDGREFTVDDVFETLDYILKNPQVKTPLKVYLEFAGKNLEYHRIDDTAFQLIASESLEAIEPILCRIPVLSHELIQEARKNERISLLYGLRSSPEELPSIGPFILKKYAPDENRLVLERNPNYWVVDSVGRILPYVQQVVISFANTTSEISIRFRTGESDLIDNIPPADAIRLSNVRGLALFDVGPSSSTIIGWFNQNRHTDPQTDEPPIEKWQYDLFAERTFRDVISSIINRDRMVSDVYKEKAIPATGLVSPLETQWVASLENRTISTSSALQRLRDIDFSYNRGAVSSATYGLNKNPVRFSISVLAGDEAGEQIGSSLEKSLEPLGIRATVISLPYEVFYKEIFSEQPNYHLAVMTLNDVPHPYFLKELLKSDSVGHLWYIGGDAPETEMEKEMDATLDQLYAGDDSAKYNAARQLQTILHQGRFIFPLVKPHGLFGAKGKIQNVRVNHRCSTILWNLEELYFTGE